MRSGRGVARGARRQLPAVAKAALADESRRFVHERLLGKVREHRLAAPGRRRRARRFGRAKLARAEAALDAGDLAKAVDLVKSLPPQTAKATQAWLARAERISREARDRRAGRHAISCWARSLTQ